MNETSVEIAPSIRSSVERGGSLQRIILDRPKGNVLDLAMMEAILETVRALRESPETKHLKLLVFEGRGAHFSFGASVPEHLPGKIDRVLPTFHTLFRELEEWGVPTAAIVRGQCLGGALELAAFCGTIFCDDTARFGVPEANLGVFPPMAAIALPWRVGGARATRLMLTGETLDAKSAVEIGLADVIAEDPERALQEYFGRHLAGKSALALRHAWRAARRPVARALEDDLLGLESMYLTELMAHQDPVEGIRAFVERRPPVWKDE